MDRDKTPLRLFLLASLAFFIASLPAFTRAQPGPDTKRIVSVSDDTPSSAVNLERLRQLEPLYKDRIVFEELSDLTEAELMKALSTLPDDAIVLHLNFFRDRFGKVFPYEESIRLVTEHSTRPVYVARDWCMGCGVVGGKLTSGCLQGRTAAELAIRILRAAAPESLPIVHESPNQYVFDCAQLKRFGISPSSLPKGSVAIPT